MAKTTAFARAGESAAALAAGLPRGEFACGFPLPEIEGALDRLLVGVCLFLERM